MRGQTFKFEVILLGTALIWGFAFVAQRMGMDHVGPFAFTGIRFALGMIVLLPFVLLGNRFSAKKSPATQPKQSQKRITIGCIAAGLAVFLGASFQQVGLVYTTAGNAGFITGLYVVLVPVFGLVCGQRTHPGTWMGTGLAVLGLYFLSVSEHFTVSFGDVLEFFGAVFWAIHVLLLGWLTQQVNLIKLLYVKHGVCVVLSLLVAICFETNTWAGIMDASAPILYGGILSVGVAYSLQILAQRNVRPAHAAIFMSLEAVFAAIGGWLILGETLSSREVMGCGFMLSGMLVSQLYGFWFHTPATIKQTDG